MGISISAGALQSWCALRRSSGETPPSSARTQQRAIIAKDAQIADAKPSDLDIKQWLTFFQAYLVHVADAKKRLVYGAEARLKEQQRHLTKIHRTR